MRWLLVGRMSQWLVLLAIIGGLMALKRFLTHRNLVAKAAGGKPKPSSLHACKLSIDEFPIPSTAATAAAAAAADEKSVAGNEKAIVYTLRNKHMSVAVTNVGAAIVTVSVPDRNGDLSDVVLGFDPTSGAGLDTYRSGKPNFGTIVGRVANRIRNGKFELNGKSYQLPLNSGSHHLHGGGSGFYSKLWNCTGSDASDDRVRVTLSYLSPAGEMGYPAPLHVSVTYELDRYCNFVMSYQAKNLSATESTLVNLTNHAYYNLAGHSAGGDALLAHRLSLTAQLYTEPDADLIPTGQVVAVGAFEYTPYAELRTKIDELQNNKATNGGLDHNFVVNSSLEPDADGLRLAATLTDPASGRSMIVSTTAPGIQVYTANFLSGAFAGKAGIRYNKYAGVCLETQHFPDSVNRPEFPTTIVEPGGTYRHVTKHAFRVESWNETKLNAVRRATADSMLKAAANATTAAAAAAVSADSAPPDDSSGSKKSSAIRTRSAVKSDS